jgi:uncharacterized membrane-anchored protein YitT (DUF2179 family)
MPRMEKRGRSVRSWLLIIALIIIIIAIVAFLELR